MSEILYAIIISPIETVFDWIFNFVHSSFPAGGVIASIFGVSLALNILALPLYNIADSIQQKERSVVKKMEKWVLHIKRTFKGDERFMMLSEWYRQNGYHPIFALRSTLSILIQIPFFIAAYHYLRNCDLLSDASFLIFKNLGMPDSALSFKVASHAVSVNVLPFVMTAINCFSGALYAKGVPRREKMQIYALALIFLILLYNSPSGLVIYWTLNNVFSLAKNWIKKNFKNKRKMLLSFSVLLIFLVHVAALRSFGSKEFCLILFAYAIFFFCILYQKFFRFRLFGLFVSEIKVAFFECKTIFLRVVKKAAQYVPSSLKKLPKPSFALLLFSGIALSLLCGLVLPSSVIASSPIEFSFLGETSSPLLYITSTFFVFAGFFVFWPIMIFLLSGNRLRFFIPILLFALAVCAIFNVYVFKCDWGTVDVSFNLSSADILNVENPLYRLVPLEILCSIVLASFVAFRRMRAGIMTALIFAASLGMAAFSLTKIKAIQTDFAKYEENLEKYGSKGFLEGDEVEKVYHFSKTQKNVLVLFLDRGMGPFVKGIFEEFPEIKEKFDGFTFYPNTISFSCSTVTGSLPLYGGYEYTQDEINKRDTELLRDKNNEAQLLMPKLFLDAGFSATVTDPCWPNFKWSGDLSAYEKFPEIVAKELEGKLYENFIKEKGLTDYNDADSICKKQIVNFSFLQVLYPNLRKPFYEKARILPVRKGLDGGAKGWLWRFSHLYYLPLYTDFDAEQGAFINMHSLAAHDVFTPSDDLETPAAENLKDWNGRSHFLADAACFTQFGKFFDLLKENGCYDNTRIIIVSDHGWDGGELKGRFDEFENPKPHQAMWMTALLMVKDFDSHGEATSDDTFMTNADTLYLAKEGLGLSDTNPFTGKKFDLQKENGVDVHWCYDWNAANFQEATQFEFTENLNWHVSGDIYNENNWIPLTEWKKAHGGAE